MTPHSQSFWVCVLSLSSPRCLIHPPTRTLYEKNSVRISNHDLFLSLSIYPQIYVYVYIYTHTPFSFFALLLEISEKQRLVKETQNAIQSSNAFVSKLWFEALCFSGLSLANAVLVAQLLPSNSAVPAFHLNSRGI